MSRLKRFEDHRFIGDRRTMRVYDCDDADQFGELSALSDQHHLWVRNELQTFAPDEVDEARNRGFRAPKPRSTD
jgi:hypothetical protein